MRTVGQTEATTPSWRWAEALTVVLDVELAALAPRRAKTRALKQGMMQELLTGRTHLI